MNYESVTDIAAPIERVWALIDDPRNLHLWSPDIRGTEYPDGIDPTAPVGARFIQRMQEGGREAVYNGVVKGYKKERLLHMGLANEAIDLDLLYSFVPSAKGTLLTFRCEATLKAFLAALFAPMAWLVMRGTLDKQMQALKSVAEGDVALAAPQV